jgi:tetratricopeptide (TPR) repeat protein
MRFKSVFNRCGFLYLIVGLIIFVAVDHRKVILKTLDELHSVPENTPHIAKARTDPFVEGFNTSYTLQQILRYYQNMLGLFPDSAIVHSIVGYCHYLRGDLAKARAAYEKAVNFDKNFFGLYYNLGIINWHLENFDRAAEAFDKALQTPPDRTLKYFDYIDPYNDGDADITDRSRFVEQRLAALNKGYFLCRRYLDSLRSAEGNREDVLQTSALYFYGFDGKRQYQAQLFKNQKRMNR